MLNYYKKSEKAFKEYVKRNPNCSKEEWDKYAQENCLFSANTLMFHLFHDDLLDCLNKKKINKFEYLKNMFFWIPIQYRKRGVFKAILKMRNINTKEEKVR